MDDYAPLSGFAVAGLISSLAGIVAVFQPWLVAVPALAVVVSIVAVARLSRPTTRAGGKWMAAFALLLSLFLVGFASARSDARKQHLQDVARPHAETWLRLILEGRVKEAHQLTFEESLRDKGDLDHAYSIGEQEAEEAMRALSGPDGKAPGFDAMAGLAKPRRDELEKFVAMPNVEKLLKLTPDAMLTFVSDELILDSASKSTISETFSVADDTGRAPPFEVTLVLERNDYGDHGSWHVSMQ
ncbi:MAG: hypothetical protein CMJ64_15015 [Planctomycetaceae bacterium]|nr:hypothetical protein [Planctomycetaceae bacterium]